jgi:RimJ/RimL family protein N-acetyltransferase
MAVLAIVKKAEKEEIVGVGRYFIDDRSRTAEIAFAVRDDYQNKGIGYELLCYLTYLAKSQGLIGFTAEVLSDNMPMLHLFDKMGFDTKKTSREGVYLLKMVFK